MTAAQQAAFIGLDESNTAVVALSDPRPNHYHTRKVCTIANPRGIACAVLMYARERQIDPRAVEYSVTWPTQKRSAQI